MELKKANLHMDQIKCRLHTQITLEEDKNISDRNPDVERILMEKGRIVIEELRPSADSLFLKGRLLYDVLYSSQEENDRLYRVQGEIPWEEKIRVEGMESTDHPQVQASIEDFRSSRINSRKINLKGLVDFCIQTRELLDEEILLDIENGEDLEIKREPYSQSVIVADKQDIFRIKEELELPSSLPPIGEVLWKYLELGKWEIKPLEDTISIQGEVHLFLLYESAEEEPQIKAYETDIPFSGNLECPGINSGMIADIIPVVSSRNINVKPDYDGEDRMLDVEMVLELPMQIYEQREMEQITDVYAASMEVIPEFLTGTCKKMRDRTQGRCKVTEQLRLPASSGKILQICHRNGKVFLEDSREENGGLWLEGVLQVQILYLTDKEERKYEVLKKEIPFSCFLENQNLTAECRWKVSPMLEQLQAVILDENNVEVKAVLDFEILIEEIRERRYVAQLKVQPVSEEKLNHSPGIVVYIPNQKETLWQIGKQYGVSLESIRELNRLTGEEVEKGQKILLVKERKA